MDPKGDHVYVKVQDAEEETLGGVLLPGSVQQRPTSGAVVSVGDGTMPAGKPLEFTVSTGDEVGFTAILCVQHRRTVKLLPCLSISVE